MNRLLTRLLEKDKIPDGLIRRRIRSLLKKRIQEETFPSAELQQQHLMEIIGELKNAPIAIETAAANAQHYEVPAEFFSYVLGRNMKYSGCYWNPNTHTLEEAETLALSITCERAGLQDGMRILELGCGWGSLTLFMAKRFPKAEITAVSNSTGQKKYIDRCCAERGISNVEVITADINVFSTEKRFDRVVSVEMFEHMRNYEKLLEKIHGYLLPEGKLFVHIFTHRAFTYYFEVKDADDWMSKYFFTGGIMPSDNLLLYFNTHFRIKDHWHWDGTHYEKTANAWLANMDAHRKEIMPVLASAYGEKNSLIWWVYWRIFFMACAELWGYNNGREWMVSHYLFERTATVKNEN